MQMNVISVIANRYPASIASLQTEINKNRIRSCRQIPINQHCVYVYTIGYGICNYGQIQSIPDFTQVVNKNRQVFLLQKLITVYMSIDLH